MGIPPFLAIDTEPLSDQEIDAAAAEEVSPWSVTDHDAAEWALAKIAEIAAKESEVREQHKAYKARLDAWLEQETSSLAHRRAWLESRVIEYAAMLRDDDPKRNKTLSLPSGKVSSRVSKPAARIVDHDEVARWLRESLPEVAEKAVKSEVRVTELRKALTVRDADGTLVAVTLDGEQPPGVVVDDGGVSWSVSPA